MAKIYTLFIIFCLSANFGYSQSLSGSKHQDKVINCFPNPATSQITFTLSLYPQENYSLVIYNLLGKLVFEEKKMSPRQTIQLGDFHRGMYIYQLKDKNGKLITTGKFQVSN